MKQTKRIVINTISSWIALFTTAGVMIFVVKFLLHRLGTERFGMFRYVTALQGSLMFLDLGLGATLNRFTSRLLTVKNYERLNAVASFGFLMFFVQGILAGAIMVGLGFALPALLPGSEASLYSRGFLLMCCIGGMLTCRLISYCARGLLFGSQRYDLVNGLQTGGSLLRAGLITVMFLKVPSSGLATIGLCFLASAICETLMTWVLAKRQVPSLRLGFSLIEREIAKEIMGFSVFVLLMAVTTMLIWNIPMFLAGRLYGAQAVAYLSLPLLLLEQIQRVAGGFGFSLIPVAGKYGALGDTRMLRELTIKGTKYCALLCFPIGVLAVIFAHPLFEWFKEGFGWTWALLGILMVPYLMRMTQRPSYSVLMGARSVRRLALGQIFLVVAIGILSLSFGKYFDMGLYGIILGVAIPILYFNSVFQTKYTCHQVGLNWLSYMHQSYSRVAIGTIPTAVAGVVLIRYFYPNGLLMIVTEGLICMLVYAVCAWLYVLKIDERKQILAVFKGKLSSSDNAEIAVEIRPGDSDIESIEIDASN